MRRWEDGKIEKTWHVSSKSEKFEPDEELTNISKQWGIGIEVSITNPYIYSLGLMEND